MDMLHTVIRPSIERPRTASPVYSTTYPAPNLTPNFAMIARIRSFAVTPAPRGPFTLTFIVFGRSPYKVCVARTCSTSLVPIPNARAPNAPCVDVRSEEHTSELQSRGHLVCRLLLEK